MLTNDYVACIQEVKISVSEGGCTLLSPTDLQLKPMIGQLLSAREVISRLVFSGICLCMSNEDATALDGVSPKVGLVYGCEVYAKLPWVTRLIWSIYCFATPTL